MEGVEVVGGFDTFPDKVDYVSNSCGGKVKTLSDGIIEKEHKHSTNKYGSDIINFTSCILIGSPRKQRRPGSPN